MMVEWRCILYLNKKGQTDVSSPQKMSTQVLTVVKDDYLDGDILQHVQN